jgi:ribonuclease G
MHSEPAAVSERELPAYEHAEPTAPIQHEEEVVDGLVRAPVTVPPFTAHFEPGTGLLEEEVLEDDDETGVIHAIDARAAAEFEPQEQVALENAADLGTMLREMSIDQLTRTEPALDDEEEEDDFEEDFLEEDQDFDAEEDEDEEEAGDDLAFGEIGNESELENGELGEPGGIFEDAAPREVVEGAEHARPADREPRRDGRGDRGRGRDSRRDGRGGRDRRPGSSDRGYSSGSSERGRHDGRGRQSAQLTNLPAISDLLKPGQEILVQIAKEPIAKKGARITSHIALPGRFLVFMPTVSHTGVSRKIESDAERRRLKEILLSERGEAQGGFIVRTAAAGASEEELRSDLRFLLNLWADIKARSESSKSPALIYHDLNLIERVLRDQVTDNFSAIWVDSETEYERVLRFLQRFQPSLIRRVKLYTKETPLFEQFGITEEINKALRSKVWLKSGGSIVINQTEALVAIDINTGKYVGKTARLEDTIVKTNLDAIPEIVRQIRLRDLGGIIIIDFIDMDERKNRNKVMQALEEELKLDRAPSKVLQFNDFGLVAITRKRVKQSLERTLSTTCGVCQGTGMVKSPVTICNDIYVEMKKMAKHLDRGDVMLRVHPDVVKQLKAPSTHWLQELEEMCGKTILVKSDPSLHPEQFDIH